MGKFRYGKWMALAVFFAAAGCSYSCGKRDQGELLAALQAESPGEGQEEVQEETQKDVSRRETEEVQEYKGTEAGEEPAVSEEAGASCFVHVCGEVENPGVYELAEGQRVFEAIAMAGGFCEGAARDYLNLAEPVWDGMRLEVPNHEQAPATEWTAPAGSQAALGRGFGVQPGASPGKVNINTAAKEELMTLKGIGEAKAEDIIRYRQQRGGFERIEDIMEISGIKNAAFEKIKDDITV